jgi:hypothetical protein
MKESTVLTALATLLGLLVLGLSISTATTSTTCEVTPTTYSDLGPGGNVDCTDIGAYQFTSGRLDGGLSAAAQRASRSRGRQMQPARMWIGAS